jgi:hypothetical protein
MFRAELSWLCSYSVACYNGSLEAHQNASRYISTERAVLDDVKDWASETIAELMSQVEELQSEACGLREGLDDVKSMRRITTVHDIPCECDFYLNRQI